MRCLAKDPADRPASAIQVAAALPGNDPLAAAIAAGEPPSPEMVAASTNEGALRPAVAVACLLATLLVLGALLWATKPVTLHERVPLQKSLEALADRARTLCQKFGYSDAPTDSAYGVTQERNYWEYGFLTQAPAEFWLTFGGARHLIAYLLSSVPDAVFNGMGCLLFLLPLYLLLRREWLATAAAWLLMYVILSLLFTVSWSDRALYLAQAAAVVIAISRFGLLSSIVYMLFFALSFDYPLTMDASKWYAGNSMFAVGVMLALSGYGFYTSLGAQKVFAGKLLEE